MNNFFGDRGKTSGQYLADEVKRGYKATQIFFIVIAIVATLFFILKVLPTMMV